jgi:hypothetical protein
MILGTFPPKQVKKVTLYSTEVVSYEWDIFVPDHIDATDGDAVWNWANERELLEFDQCQVEDRINEVEQCP